MRWTGQVENALFNAFGGSLLFVALHAEEIFRPNGGFGQLLPLYGIEAHLCRHETDAPNRCHSLKERKLNYATYKYHENTLALARDRRLWFNTHPQPSGCSCTGPKAVQVQPGTSFRRYSRLPRVPERSGNRHRFSEGGRSRCGHAGFACRGPA